MASGRFFEVSKHLSVNLSDAFLARFLSKFLDNFLARVLTRVWGREKAINTVYSTTQPKEKHVKT